MPILNLGVVAHVDAGKTTLTERLLFEAGVTDAVGRVDHGDTVTDADDQERRRGITIRSAVVAFQVRDVTVHLVDTPGHSDFVAEVERALAVLDGAVLVVSAVEGVQAQTRVLIRILERLRIPFVVFVNKIDRVGASIADTMSAIREAVSGDALLLTVTSDVGTRQARSSLLSGSTLIDDVAERAADFDEEFLAAYVGTGATLAAADVRRTLARLTATGQLHPTFTGAALVGTGVADLLAEIPQLLPAAHGTGDELQAGVFKIERGRAGRRIAYARMRSGSLSTRQQVRILRQDPTGRVVVHEGRVTSVERIARAARTVPGPALPGDIAVLSGLSDVQIGDQLGRWDPSASSRHFAPPGLESVVEPVATADRLALFAALRELSAQDPLIDARLDGPDEAITVSLYGEVQKEVLTERLRAEFGVTAAFSDTRTVHVERVVGVGEDEEIVPSGNAIVGLRVAPGAIGSGTSYGLAVERGWLLPAYHTAIEETLATELRVGPLGWRVVDCTVTLIQSRFSAPTPPAGYFRQLTAVALRRALDRAGTVACEPFSGFEVDAPLSSLTVLLHRLIAARATPDEPTLTPSRCRLTGTLPTSQVHAFERRLPDLTSGLGSMSTWPDGFRAVTGPPPSRR